MKGVASLDSCTHPAALPCHFSADVEGSEDFVSAPGRKRKGQMMQACRPYCLVWLTPLCTQKWGTKLPPKVAPRSCALFLAAALGARIRQRGRDRPGQLRKTLIKDAS